MEYKIFQKIRTLPLVVRVVLGVVLIIFGSIALVTPLLGAAPAIVVGLLFLIRAKQIPRVIKIRKSLTYLFQNFEKKIIKQKAQDIKRDFFRLFRSKK
ncbi:hypothetical protein COB57_01355 [Candidatus Peregrinibacteria bacterium]|nr:MAG: hypothetical protein COB57_01355 [Candidatus Peregrinibacteria bacterium]